MLQIVASLTIVFYDCNMLFNGHSLIWRSVSEEEKKVL
jgi:hypothetical protein